MSEKIYYNKNKNPDYTYNIPYIFRFFYIHFLVLFIKIRNSVKFNSSIP